MKKVLYVFIFLSMNLAFADVDFTKAIKSTSMPTDSEIRAVLKQFEFTGEQEDAVFKEVKAKLKNLYSQDIGKSNLELNQYMNQINNEAVGVFMDNQTKQQLMRDLSKMQ